MNYFFGQNGPGPISGASLERHNNSLHAFHGAGGGGIGGSSFSHGFVPVGRDVSAPEVTMSSGLMAGKRGIDGNSAAYDMKSLGKHIEAVCHSSFHFGSASNAFFFLLSIFA